MPNSVALRTRFWSARTVNRPAVLAAFDDQVRRRPEGPGVRVERDDDVIRVQPAGADGWAGVTWSDLDDTNADAVIAAQVARFGPREWEWKHYSYDQPADLPERLLQAGFRAEPAETLLVAEIAELDLDGPTPAGVTLADVVDQRGVDDLVAVHDVVFGGDRSALGRTLLAAVQQQPVSTLAVVAYAEGRPISSGRLELYRGTDFAGLWGGGTEPAWRGRGVFRALVAHRARAAAAQGFRFLQVDASADSRPILNRLGFVELATTTPFVHARRTRTHG